MASICSTSQIINIIINVDAEISSRYSDTQNLLPAQTYHFICAYVTGNPPAHAFGADITAIKDGDVVAHQPSVSFSPSSPEGSGPETRFVTISGLLPDIEDIVYNIRVWIRQAFGGTDARITVLSGSSDPIPNAKIAQNEADGTLTAEISWDESVSEGVEYRTQVDVGDRPTQLGPWAPIFGNSLSLSIDHAWLESIAGSLPPETPSAEIVIILRVAPDPYLLEVTVYWHRNSSPRFNALSLPNTLQVTAISQGLELDWQQAVQIGNFVDHYEYRHALADSASFVAWSSTAGKETEATISGLIPSVAYRVQVRAVDQHGNYSNTIEGTGTPLA